MTAEQIARVEAKAEEALRYVIDADGEVDLPVDLGLITRAIGLEVQKAEFEDPTIDGLLRRGEKTAYVAKDRGFPRTSFTLAHEIGHFLLHEHLQEDVYRTSLIEGASLPEIEKEANWFAAAVLMPKTIVQLEWFKLNNIELMAQIFGVSNSAMFWRLKNLGLIEA